MNTRGGFNLLYDPITQQSAKIPTGCKNPPSRDGLFCNTCFELAMKNKELVKLYDTKESDKHEKSTVKELMKKEMVFIEEIENSWRHNRSEIKIKLFGIPKRVFINIRDLPKTVLKDIRRKNKQG